MDIAIQIGLTLLGFAVMIAGADLLVRGASGIARSLGIPPIVIGLTIVAYGTSMPEFMASFSAMRKDVTGIAVGNVLGSNVCNIALVLGCAALLTRVRMERDVFTRQLPITLIVTFVLMGMFVTGDRINRTEGAILALGIIVYTVWIFRRGRSVVEIPPGLVSNTVFQRSGWMASGAVAVGCLGLFFGSDWMVDGATGLAESFDVPSRVIGGTLVAFGTSLPELITTVWSIVKKETDLGVGNAVGSCIFNILMVLGFTAVYKPIRGSLMEYHIEFIFSIFTIVLLWPLSGRNLQLGRSQGVILVGVYLLFIYVIF
jgi:cation:H+ antiporter